MKKTIFIFGFLMAIFTVHAQKEMIIPKKSADSIFFSTIQNQVQKLKLEDLTKTEDSLSIRIWNSHNIVEFNLQSNNYNSALVTFIQREDPIIATAKLDNELSKALMDSIVSMGILNFPDDTYRGIDGNQVFIEISTPKIYRIYSYWSPFAGTSFRGETTENVAQIIELLNRRVGMKVRNISFINSLEPGNYQWGMSSIKVDRLLQEGIEKSSGYKVIEKHLKEDLHIDHSTDHRDFPLFLLNDEQILLGDFNKIEEPEIKKIEILKREDIGTAIYGARARNGVVSVQTY